MKITYARPEMHVKDSTAVIQCKKIHKILTFQSKIQTRLKLKNDSIPAENIIQTDFKQLLTKRSKNSQFGYKVFRKKSEQIRNKKLNEHQLSQQKSRSKSKSREIMKCKSSKALLKNNKSWSKLFHSKEKRQRRSLSPNQHQKSLTIADKKNYRSTYNSKTTRDQHDLEKQKFKPKGNTLIVCRKGKKLQNQGQSEERKKIIKKQFSSLKIIEKKGKEPKIDKQNKKKKKKNDISKNKKQKKNLEGNKNDKTTISQTTTVIRDKVKQNFINLPNKKQRLSLNFNRLRNDMKAVKTQGETGKQRQILEQDMEKATKAAIVIQKVFRGYLTRKYISEILEQKAAIKIQKVWRGYLTRKQIQNIVRKKKIVYSQVNEPYLIIDHAPTWKEESINQTENSKYTSILEEILSEDSVSNSLKQKIENFLEGQRHRASIDSKRSANDMSSRIVMNEMASERNYMAQKKTKIKKQEELNNSSHMTPPFHQELSPSFSAKNNLMIANLRKMQQSHRLHVIRNAMNQKRELQQLLSINQLSPRTHKNKVHKIDAQSQEQINRFGQNINQIVRNYQQMVNIPTKSQIFELNMSPKQQEILEKVNGIEEIIEMSAELREFKEGVQEQFQTQYYFIQQYLISLIEFMREYNDGEFMNNMLSLVQKSKNADILTILRNRQEVEQDNNSFRLPLYKLLEMEEDFLGEKLLEQFNSRFNTLQRHQFGTNNLQECYLSMIAACMNEALNSLRPFYFPYFHSLIFRPSTTTMQRFSFDCDNNSIQQLQFQFICAQALNQIFDWNKLGWGKQKLIGQTQYEGIGKEMFDQINMIESGIIWDYCEEMIEACGQLSDIVFQELMLEVQLECTQIINKRNFGKERSVQVQCLWKEKTFICFS